MDPASGTKPTLDSFFKDIPQDTLEKQLGYVDPEKTTRLCLDPELGKNVVSSVREHAVCSPYRLGKALGLSSRQIDEEIQAFSGNKGQQIRNIVCKWIEANPSRATVQTLMGGLWNSDDIQTLRHIQEMCATSEATPDRKAEGGVHPLADSVLYPSDLPTGSRYTTSLVQQAESPGCHHLVTASVLAQQKPPDKLEERPLELTLQEPFQASVPQERAVLKTPSSDSSPQNSVEMIVPQQTSVISQQKPPDKLEERPLDVTLQEPSQASVHEGAIQETSSSDSSPQNLSEMVVPRPTSDSSQTFESKKVEMLERDMAEMKIDMKHFRRDSMKDKEDTHREMKKLGKENADLKLILEERTKELWEENADLKLILEERTNEIDVQAKEIEELKNQVSELERNRAEKTQLSIKNEELREKVDLLNAKNKQLFTSLGQLGSEVMKLKQNAEKEKQTEEENKQLKTNLQSMESMVITQAKEISWMRSRLKELDPEFVAEEDAGFKEETVDGCVGFLNTSHGEPGEEPKYTDLHCIIKSHQPNCMPNDIHLHTQLVSFAKKAVLLLHTCNDTEFWAAVEKLEPPIGDDNQPLVNCPVYYPGGWCALGMFACYKTAVMKTKQGHQCIVKLTTELPKHFPATKVIIGVGIGYARDRNELQYADVMISNEIADYSQFKDQDGEITTRGPRPDVHNSVADVFCIPEVQSWEFPCTATNSRKSSAQSGCIVSAPCLMRNEERKKQLFKYQPKAKGGEMEGWALLMVQQMVESVAAVIIIKGVADYGDNEKNDKWQLTAAKAAVDFTHYSLVKAGVNAFKD